MTAPITTQAELIAALNSIAAFKPGRCRAEGCEAGIHLRFGEYDGLCPDCLGTGRALPPYARRCGECGGRKGSLEIDFTGNSEAIFVDCPDCSGRGYSVVLPVRPREEASVGEWLKRGPLGYFDGLTYTRTVPLIHAIEWLGSEDRRGCHGGPLRERDECIHEERWRTTLAEECKAAGVRLEVKDN